MTWTKAQGHLLREQVAEATLALVHSHNALLRDRQLKVSFSKNAVDSDVGLPE